jgi:hypothetical protein
VEAESRLHGLADLARGERERRVLELLHHLPAREESEVAAALLRAGILGELRATSRTARRLDPLLAASISPRDALDARPAGASGPRAQDVARVDALGRLYCSPFSW